MHKYVLRLLDPGNEGTAINPNFVKSHNISATLLSANRISQ